MRAVTPPSITPSLRYFRPLTSGHDDEIEINVWWWHGGDGVLLNQAVGDGDFEQRLGTALPGLH